MSTVRAKFYCAEKTENEVRFYAVSGGSEENEKFWQYTPDGNIYMHVDNPAAQDRFEVGKEYYVDFTPAE